MEKLDKGAMDLHPQLHEHQCSDDAHSLISTSPRSLFLVEFRLRIYSHCKMLTIMLGLSATLQDSTQRPQYGI